MSIRKNMLWNTIGSVIYLFAQWLTTIIVVRLLGYEEAGVLSLAMSITTAFYSLQLFGMRNYQISDIVKEYTDKQYVQSRYFTIIVGIVFCAVITFWGGYSTREYAAIMVYMLFKSSEALVDVYNGSCQNSERMDIIGKSFILRGILMLTVLITILYTQQDLVLGITGMAIAMFLVVIIYDIPQTRKIRSVEKQTSEKKLKNLFLSCVPLTAYTIGLNLIPAIPRLVLDNIAGNEILGIYASIAMPSVIIQVAASFLYNPIYTPMAIHYNTKRYKEFKRMIYLCLGATFCVGIIGMVGVQLFGRWGLSFLFGEDILQYYELLMPTIICSLLTAFVWFLCASLTIVRDIKNLIKSNAISLVACVVGSFVLVPSLGAQGVSITIIVALTLNTLLLFVSLLKKLKKV